MTTFHSQLSTTGVAILSTVLVVGAAIAGVSPAVAANTATMTAAAKTGIAAGAVSAPVANVNYKFTNDYNTNASVTFTIGNNDCSTAAGVAKAVGLKSGDVPTFAIVSPTAAAGDPAVTPVTATVTYNMVSDCAVNGVFDEFTVTLNPSTPATGDPALIHDLTISNLKYTVGVAADLGDVTIAAVGKNGLGDASVANAAIVGTALTVDPFTAVEPFADETLGDVVIAESGAGASFTAAVGTSTVLLELPVGPPPFPSVITVFDTGKKPTVTAAGFTVDPDTDITFPSPTQMQIVLHNAAALTEPVTVTVSNIAVDTGLPDQIFVSATVNGDTVTAAGGVKVANVISSDTRYGGSDRYATAAKMYAAAFTTSNVAVVASGESFPDALSGGYLASEKGTGLLLTRKNSLPFATKVALNRNVDTVYILGGPGAVSEKVENEIRALSADTPPDATIQTIETIRVAGDDRYVTNHKINTAAASGGSETTVLMASGVDFPDALALGPVAYRQGWPLILSNGIELTDGNKAQFDDLDVTRVVIAGGTGAVSQNVEDAIEALGIKVSRVAGADRQETATNIATWVSSGLVTTPADAFLALPLGFNNVVGFTTGVPGVNNFADALAAGPVLGNAGGVLLLTQTEIDLGPAATGFLENSKVGFSTSAQGRGLQGLIALGGRAVISDLLVGVAAQLVEK